MLRFALIAAVAATVVATFALAQDDPDVEMDGVVALNPDNYDTIVGGDKPVLVEYYASWCGHCKNLVPEYTKLGKAVKASAGKVVVAKLNADKHQIPSVQVSGFPTIKYFGANSKDGEDYQGGRDAESFIKFLNDKAGAGLFMPYIHSDVKTINAVNYDKITKDANNKVVLISHTAPWCGHCKSLKPTWKDLAAVFANDKNVVIGDFNADAEENKAKAGELGISGFPTIKYFVAGGAAEDYNGGRSLDDLVSFINEKAGTQRAASGGLSAEAGTTPELNAAAAAYTANGDKSKFAEASNEWYAKVAASIDSKGEGYVEKELARITKMLDGGKLSAAKRDQMSLKKNVLTAFKK